MQNNYQTIAQYLIDKLEVIYQHTDDTSTLNKQIRLEEIRKTITTSHGFIANNFPTEAEYLFTE